MRNLAVTISYDGRNYHGWQVQSNAITIQEVFQNALEHVFGDRVDVKGCSRTDSGVHANMYVINFFTENSIRTDKLILALNHWLPRDISAYKCAEMPMDFHARYSCLSKEYIYQIWNSPYRNPFLDGFSLHYYNNIDVSLLNYAAEKFIGTYDFSAFCSFGDSLNNHIRNVIRSGVSRNGKLITFTVQADGFLYNMVRIMTGTLLFVAQGKINPDKIEEIILSKDRRKAGITAPPSGLFLNRVFYQ